jgi:hypothetical protein
MLNYWESIMAKMSEFVCSVCGRKELRDLDKEWDNITFSLSRNGPQPVTLITVAPYGGFIWTCSEECKTMYCLQKTI